MENKIEELNKEFEKYSKSIVKLLELSLKEGEVFIFKKLSDGGYGLILSREREGLSNVGRLEDVNYISKILDIMESEHLYL